MKFQQYFQKNSDIMAFCVLHLLHVCIGRIYYVLYGLYFQDKLCNVCYLHKHKRNGRGNTFQLSLLLICGVTNWISNCFKNSRLVPSVLISRVNSSLVCVFHFVNLCDRTGDKLLKIIIKKPFWYINVSIYCRGNKTFDDRNKSEAVQYQYQISWHR